MLKSINLSITSLCGAKCIYCPTDRGKCLQESVMPFSIFKKVIDEMASKEFLNEHRINRVIVGENGDALLNRELIEMLRYIRKELPNIKVILYTNFQNFSQDIARTIVKEGLIDILRCNIDGSTPKNYYSAKKIKYGTFLLNFKAFLRLRSEFKKQIALHISVLTLNNYINTIHNNLGFYPTNMVENSLLKVKNDYNDIVQKFSTLLDKKIDRIFESYLIGGWAERSKIDTNKIDYRKYACPNRIRIEHEAFIAPDGSWYICCLDSANRIKLGNIKEKSLNEIFSSEKRKKIMYMLKHKEFKNLGEPCNTVVCCQHMHRNKKISNIYRIIFKNELLVRLLYKLFSEK